DVLAVGNGNVLLLHELAFLEVTDLLDELRALLGGSFVAFLATEKELPVASAVAAYPFNSQLLTLPDGSMTIVAPEEAREDPRPAGRGGSGGPEPGTGEHAGARRADANLADWERVRFSEVGCAQSSTATSPSPSTSTSTSISLLCAPACPADPRDSPRRRTRA